MRGAEQHLSSTGTRVVHKKNQAKVNWQCKCCQMREQGQTLKMMHQNQHSTSFSYSAQVKQVTPRCQLKAAVLVHKGSLRDSRGCCHQPSPCTHSLCRDVSLGSLRPVPHVEFSQVGKERNNDKVVPSSNASTTGLGSAFCDEGNPYP